MRHGKTRGNINGEMAYVAEGLQAPWSEEEQALIATQDAAQAQRLPAEPAGGKRQELGSRAALPAAIEA